MGNGPAEVDEDVPVDVIVVGGGPAGTTGALYLARFARSAVLVDAGRSRASAIPLTHNYPGFAEGIEGPALLAAMRGQLAPYPVRRLQQTVVSVRRMDAGFAARCADGQELRGRMLLLATGVTDLAPSAPGMDEALRDGALRYCPVCDAYEVRGRAVGVLANDASGVAEALYLRHFTSDVRLFVEQGAVTLGSGPQEQLARAGISVAEAPVQGIHRRGARIAVTHGEDTTERDTLYCALGVNVHAELARQLGAACDDDGYVQVDAHCATTVEGVYAVGDVAQGLNQIAVATGRAAIAASAIHQQLRKRDEDTALRPLSTSH